MSGLGISLFRNGWPKRGTTEALWRADWRSPATHANGLPWPEWFDPALGTVVMETIRFENALLSRAPATLVFDTPASATFSIARWNQIKAAEFHGVDLAQLVVRNIVDAVVSAGETFSHDRFKVVLEGSKRGMLVGHAERGNDFVLRVDSNARGDRDNTFLIRGGSGDDTVVVERSLFDWSATGGFRQTYVETWTVVRADLGGGNNRFTSGGSRDHVIVGDGDDVVSTGGGDDTLAVRGGRNVFDGGPGCDTLILRGAFAGYTLSLDDRFRFVIEDIDPTDGDDGTTVLVDVEKIVFEGNPGGPFTLRLMPCDNDQARNRRPTAEADAYVIDEDLGVLLVGRGSSPTTPTRTGTRFGRSSSRRGRCRTSRCATRPASRSSSAARPSRPSTGHSSSIRRRTGGATMPSSTSPSTGRLERLTCAPRPQPSCRSWSAPSTTTPRSSPGCNA